MQMNKNKLLFLYVSIISIFCLPVHAGEIVDDALQSLQLDNASGVAEGLKRGLDVNFVDSQGNNVSVGEILNELKEMNSKLGNPQKNYVVASEVNAINAINDQIRSEATMKRK